MSKELEAAREELQAAQRAYARQELQVRNAHSEIQRSLDQSQLQMVGLRLEKAKRDVIRLEDVAEAQQRQLDAVQEATERQLAATRENAERQEKLARQNAEDQLEAAREVAANQAAHEERTFWFRRFFTTLGIAHAGAFFAMATGLAQADDPEKIAPYLADPFTSFVCGMVLAGLIPLSLMVASGPASLDRPGHHIRRLGNFIAVLLATAAALTFVLGLAQMVGFFRGMAPT